MALRWMHNWNNLNHESVCKIKTAHDLKYFDYEPKKIIKIYCDYASSHKKRNRIIQIIVISCRPDNYITNQKTEQTKIRKEDKNATTPSFNIIAIVLCMF